MSTLETTGASARVGTRARVGTGESAGAAADGVQLVQFQKLKEQSDMRELQKRMDDSIQCMEAKLMTLFRDQENAGLTPVECGVCENALKKFREDCNKFSCRELLTYLEAVDGGIRIRICRAPGCKTETVMTFWSLLSSSLELEVWVIESRSRAAHAAVTGMVESMSPFFSTEAMKKVTANPQKLVVEGRAKCCVSPGPLRYLDAVARGAALAKESDDSLRACMYFVLLTWPVELLAQVMEWEESCAPQA